MRHLLLGEITFRRINCSILISIKLRDETLLKEVSDCGEAADAFLKGELNPKSGFESWNFSRFEGLLEAKCWTESMWVHCCIKCVTKLGDDKGGVDNLLISVILLKRRNVNSKPSRMKPYQERSNARKQLELAKMLRWDYILNLVFSKWPLLAFQKYIFGPPVWPRGIYS